MNTITIVLLIVGAIAAGAVISWLVTRANWTVKLAAVTAELNNAQKLLADQKTFMENADRAMRETFGSLAAHALHQNNEAFVALAESKLGEKVTQAKGALEVKEKAIEGLVKPLAESLGKMDAKINDLENKREKAYSNISTILDGMQRTAQALDKGTQGLDQCTQEQQHPRKIW